MVPHTMLLRSVICGGDSAVTPSRGDLSVKVNEADFRTATVAG